MRLAAVALAALVAATPAVAQTSYPSKPVKILVPNAPGAIPDLIARLVGERLGRILNTSFVIENNTAGAGIVSAQTAAKAPADGYTLFVGTITSMALNPHLFASLPYNPEKDFVPVAMVYDVGSQVLAVHPDLPAKNLRELIALAKSQPGRISYAADRGLASIIGEWMFRTAGAPATLIPYKSPSQSVTDTAAGRTQAIIISIPPIEAMRKSGKLRLLAVTSLKRFPTLPDVPAVSETLPGFNGSGWSSLMAPAGTPRDILQKLNRATDQAVKEPEYQQRLLAMGYFIEDAGTLDEIAQLQRAERDKWGRIIRELGIKPE
jgi:tripartite-type tricarboxylate transporter receptor subunit TctC